MHFNLLNAADINLPVIVQQMLLTSDMKKISYCSFTLQVSFFFFTFKNLINSTSLITEYTLNGAVWSIQLGRIGQSITLLIKKPEVLGWYLVWPLTFISPFTDSRWAVLRNWRKYVHLALINCLGGLILQRNSVVRSTDRADIYHGLNP